MQLRDAIIRATKVALKEDELGQGRNLVQIRPHVRDDVGNLERLGYVAATDGDIWCIIWLDPDVPDFPDVCLESQAAKSCFSSIEKGTPVVVTPRGYTSVHVQVEDGAHFLIQSTTPSAFPDLPQFPEQLHPIEHMDLVKLVSHATGKDKDKPEAQFIHLTPNWSEATDTSRIARVAATVVNESCLITKDVFKNWPTKGKLGVAVGETDKHLVIQVGTELRLCTKHDASEWFDLSPILPELHMGHRIHLPRERLKGAVKSALSSTPTQWVELRITEDKLTISGMDAQGDAHFHDTLDGKGGAPELIIIMLQGKKLWEALHAVKDAYVTLCYVAPNQPVRMEAESYVEAIWPLYRVEEAA